MGGYEIEMASFIQNEWSNHAEISVLGLKKNEWTNTGGLEISQGLSPGPRGDKLKEQFFFSVNF